MAVTTPSIRLLREVISVHGRSSSSISSSSNKHMVLGADAFWHGAGAPPSGRNMEYSGGILRCPTYVSVCIGETGNSEVVQVEFDAAVLEPNV
jgi:hypothetical protein